MIQATVVADSKNEFGDRITTMVVTMPRMILAEFNTHRMFSRNSASSRAIPFKKMVNSVRNNPFIPMAWQKEHTGMQGTEYILDLEIAELCESIWLAGRDLAVCQAESLTQAGVTKQLANRKLEPYMWHTVIVTATEWENFFALRCPRYTFASSDQEDRQNIRSWKDVCEKFPSVRKDASVLSKLSWNKGAAEIHMMALAEAMYDAYQESRPRELKAGEWHIPFKDKLDVPKIEELYHPMYDEWDQVMIKLSTVMCARTSYTVVGEDLKLLTYDRMIEIHDKMLKDDPKHMSPFEHCAPAMTKDEYKNNHIRISLDGEVQPWMTTEDDDGRGVIVYDKADPLTGKPIWFQQYGWLGNFRGFKQYRKMIKGENII